MGGGGGGEVSAPLHPALTAVYLDFHEKRMFQDLHPLLISDIKVAKKKLHC